MAETVLEVLAEAARQHAARPALRYKREGAWHTLTWSEYHQAVKRTARGFMHLGLQPGQGVVIMGFNRPGWFLSDLGAIAAGGLPVGIYQTSTPEQCRYVSEHAQAAVAVVEDARYLEMFRPLRAALPRLRTVVLMHGRSEEPGVLSWADLQERAEGVPEAELDARIAAQRPDDCATLIYTSGTTGTPKGVMLSHRNLVWTAGMIV
jgi:long-subunit acyl-CoA synthetase (AMP-forming)